jgi:hypothetical protein
MTTPRASLWDYIPQDSNLHGTTWDEVLRTLKECIFPSPALHHPNRYLDDIHALRVLCARRWKLYVDDPVQMGTLKLYWHSDGQPLASLIVSNQSLDPTVWEQPLYARMDLGADVTGAINQWGVVYFGRWTFIRTSREAYDNARLNQQKPVN